MVIKLSKVKEITEEEKLFDLMGRQILVVPKNNKFSPFLTVPPIYRKYSKVADIEITRELVDKFLVSMAEYIYHMVPETINDRIGLIQLRFENLDLFDFYSHLQ